MPLSRRDVLRRGALLAGATALTGHGGAGADPAGPVVREGTNIALAHHRGTLAVDVANGIRVLPLSGGTARTLTTDLDDATWPSFFPDGRRIAFQSFRRGTYDLCVVEVATGAVSRLTSGPGYDVDPAVSPDGRSIAYVSDEGGASSLRLLDLATGRARTVVGADHTRWFRSPSWHRERIVYVADDDVVEEVDPATGERVVRYSAPPGYVLRAVSAGPGGVLAVVETSGPRAVLRVDGVVVTAPDEEPAPFPPVWLSATEILFGADGAVLRRDIRSRRTRAVPFAIVLSPAGRPPRPAARLDLPDDAPVRGIAGPVLSPDGGSMCFQALGAIHVWRFGAEVRRVVSDGYRAGDPDWAPGGLVYSSDRSGSPQLWRHTFATGRDEQLTRHPTGAFAPRVAPGGARVAFHDEAGATWLLDVASGRCREVVGPVDQPGRVAFSPDGRLLAMAVLVPASARDTAGYNGVLVVDLETGARHTGLVAPHRSIATRGDDGPVWTADGRYLLVVLDSLLHRVPVTPDGVVAGPPEVLSDLVADAVSTDATGRVLFLTPEGPHVLHGGSATAHRVPVRCRRRAPAPRLVLRAGALWDGTGTGYRRNVDITVSDGVVSAITDVTPNSPPPTVDAGDRVVLPGFIDVHNHWHLRGRQWGARQGPLWLAYGVTTSRSTGDPAYRMRETREAIHSGAEVGPRYLGSGEPLEGTRTQYGFMRTVSSPAQLERELRRVEALDYHVVKSYQRFPVYLERRLVRALRPRGVPVVSHYLYPATATGLHGMEHTGGGNRLGYSRTLSAAGGRTAQDTVDLLVTSGMWVSTTLLFAGELHVDHPDLVTDRRTRVLFPPWEYERLLAKVEHGHDELNRAWTAGDVDLLLRVRRAGGLVVTGTDAPLDDVGISLHQNLRALVKYGFTPVEALRAATSDAGRCLGADGVLGVVRVGARADLLVVAGDPLARIEDAARVERVFVDGHAHDIPGLLAPFESAGVPRAAGGYGPPTTRDCCRPVRR